MEPSAEGRNQLIVKLNVQFYTRREALEGDEKLTTHRRNEGEDGERKASGSPQSTHHSFQLN